MPKNKKIEPTGKLSIHNAFLVCACMCALLCCVSCRKAPDAEKAPPPAPVSHTPDAGARPHRPQIADTPSKEIKIDIYLNGDVQINNRKIARETLSAELAKLEKPIDSVKIQAVQNTPYKYIISVFEACKKNNLKDLFFISRPLEVENAEK